MFSSSDSLVIYLKGVEATKGKPPAFRDCSREKWGEHAARFFNDYPDFISPQQMQGLKTAYINLLNETEYDRNGNLTNQKHKDKVKQFFKTNLLKFCPALFTIDPISQACLIKPEIAAHLGIDEVNHETSKLVFFWIYIKFIEHQAPNNP